MTIEELRTWIGKTVRVTEDCHDWGNVEPITKLLSIVNPTICLVDRNGQSWYVYTGFIRLVKDDMKVNPYPHKCIRCNLPARKCGKMIMCSNSRCKSWKQIKKSFPPIEIKNYRDKNNYLICEKCREGISICLIGGIYRMACLNRHISTYAKINGDKIIYSGKTMVWKQSIGWIYE